VAASTGGLCGAELANLVNEAAIRATRRAADALAYQDFAAALDEYRSSRAADVQPEAGQWAMAAMLSQLAQRADASPASAID
jgi:ATP-dependent 26S proteasome regulatory subunit